MLTADLAERHEKPWLHLELAGLRDAEAALLLAEFIARHRIVVLNIAGSSESLEPGIYQRTVSVVRG